MRPGRAAGCGDMAASCSGGMSRSAKRGAMSVPHGPKREFPLEGTVRSTQGAS